MKKLLLAFTIGWIMCTPLLAADMLYEDDQPTINPLARTSPAPLSAPLAWEVITTDDEAKSGNNSDSDSSSDDHAVETAISADVLQMRLLSSSPDFPNPHAFSTTPMFIRCVPIELQSPDIRNADSLQHAIKMGFTFIRSCGIAMNQASWVFDVDGTTNTYPDPSKTYEWNFALREECLKKVRGIKSQGGLVYFSSAWNDPLNGEEKAFEDILARLRATGFTNEDLGISEEEQPRKVFVELQTQLLGSVYLIALKCGNVVSCTSPTKPGFYFRGKFFAPAIARPELCTDVKALIAIDDGRSNLEALISDLAQHNPYGTETIALLPILLAEYKPLLVASAVV